jgi:hypothetical protein
MFSTCIFCRRPLGANTVLETFPVGRRLAFDAARGRLWVVCRSCERWNLSPLEERWEALESAERLFRDTRARVSTENIGLARHPEGLELVRVGRPLRPEFAAWRYGDQFGRRRRRAVLLGAGGAAAVGAAVTVGVATGLIAGFMIGPSTQLMTAVRNLRTLVTVRTADGATLKLRQRDIMWARLRRGDDGAPVLVAGRKATERVFTGAEAERVTALIMPRVNAYGGRPAVVQSAVREVERTGGPAMYLGDLLTHVPLSVRLLLYGEGVTVMLGKLPAAQRLALEMALHEEQERRALEGELQDLMLAWRDAEEIAAIADDLLLPDQVRTRFDDLAGRSDAYG